MTEYERNLPVVVAFPPQRISEGLGETLSRANLTQLRLAESEKERFVTFYFNGQIESPFPGEDRQIVPSPKVATYDLAPQMSAKQVTQIAIDNLANSKYSFMVINYANPDMVGHTGNIPAAITACETIDECLGQLVKAVLAANGVLVITADHGNVEQMLLPEGGSDTEHNSNDVPFIVVANNLNPNTKIESGILADIAPTILNFLAVPKPKSMTGRILISL
jgi:2,3-bisphosphoglycerate-independent phosphoglycerate mutase